MGYKVDSLQLELTVTAKQTASSLNRVANALKKIKEETKDMSALAKLRKELTNFSKVNLTPIADALKTIASSSVKAREKLSQMLAETDKTPKFEPVGNTEFLDSLESKARDVKAELGGIELHIGGNTEFLDALSGELGEIEHNSGVLTDIQEEYRGVTGNVVKLTGAEKEADEAAKRFKESLQKTNSELSTASKKSETAKKAVSGIQKIWNRFVKYAGYRTIRTAFNAVTQSFTEGLKEAYLWSAEAENGYSDIANTMDDIKTGIVQFKRQLGSAVGEFIGLVKPAIEWLFDAVNSISDALSQFFAALGGKDSYMKAKKVQTAWEDTTDSTKEATKAAKDYKKTLLGIDELNVLGKDNDKGKTSDLEVPESAYELVALDKDAYAVDLGLRVKDVLFNWDDLNAAQIGQKIVSGLGILAGGIVGFSIGGVPGAIVGSLVGFGLSIIIGDVLFDEKKAKYAPRTYKQDIVNTGIGSVVGGIIGAIVAGPVGAAVGLTVGAGITMLIDKLVITDEEEKMNHYLDSELKKWLDDKRKEIDAYMKSADDIIVNISNIDPTLDSEEVQNLEFAKSLIEDIFALDEIDVKTPEQLEELKSKIETLNGLGIPDVKIEFDELTGKIKNSKDELILLIDKMLSEAKIRAGMEKITELYKERFNALEKIKEGEKLLDDLEGKREETQKNLASKLLERKILEDDLVKLEEAENALLAEPWNLDREYELKEIQDKVESALHETNLEISDYIKGIVDLDEQIDPLKAKQGELNASVDEANEKIGILTGLIIDEKSALNKDSKAVKGNSEVLDELNKIASEYTDTASDMKKGLDEVTSAEKDAKKQLVKYQDAMGKTRDISPKLAEAIDKIKGSFKNLKTSIAESISELGKLDEAGKTKRTIELDYAVGVNMNDAATFAMLKGVGIKKEASGGFVEGGHLFFANENGNPEYIGNMGGRTAVANSDQMSAAIEQAAYAGMARALQQYGNSNSGNNWEPMSSEDMYLMLKKKATSTSRRTGVSVAF